MLRPLSTKARLSLKARLSRASRASRASKGSGFAVEQSASWGPPPSPARKEAASRSPSLGGLREVADCSVSASTGPHI